MKRILFFVLVFIVTLNSFGQFKALMQKKANVISPMNKSTNIDLPVVGEQPANNYVSNKSVLDDPVTCITRYDMQTNSSNQRRIYSYPDGTVGTTATMSHQDASWTDRGTGYNYYNGASWGPQPTARVESIKTGWPEYHPFGSTGELIIAHKSTGNLVMNTRSVKGTGNWTETFLPALPSTIPAMLWPRVVTNGINHTNIHIIALTLPTGNGGMIYNGMDGALLYCQSMDGGTSWTDWIQLAGMTSAEYTGFSGDRYAFAEPFGDTLAFTVGDCWQDQFLMKSTDNGATWIKTVIHHSLYNLGGNSGNFFYCPDGTMSIALDNQGIAHVVFGLMQDSGSRTAAYWRPYTEGIVYWNEYMPMLRQDLEPDSLYFNGQYVGWVKDTMVFYPPSGVSLPYFYTSLTSNPELAISKNNGIFLAWAGVTPLVDSNNYMLRHLFGRGAIINTGGEISWCNDTLLDITGNWIQNNLAECMYPSASPTAVGSPFYGHADILFQKDNYGGSYIKEINTGGSQYFADDNSMMYIRWTPCLVGGIEEKNTKPTLSVSQNIPNPTTDLTKVNVYLQNAGDLSLKVTNLTGQTITNMEKTNVLPGVSQFIIDGSQFAPGIYFYTVRQGAQGITKKMVVQ